MLRLLEDVGRQRARRGAGHVDFIQKHLQLLAKDFNLFNERMTKLTKHLQLANDDAKDINTSANKITRRFQSIEKVELLEDDADT